MSEDAAVRDLLRWVAVHDLPVARDKPPESATVTSEAVVSAEDERLLGALWHAVASGALPAPDEVREHLAERHRAAMLWCLHVEARLLEIADWFREAGGVEYVVVKGPAVAHLDEVDPSVRSFADLDLLVAGRHVDRAVAAVEANGGRRPWPQRRPGYDCRFAKSVTLTCPDGVEVDLHRSLCDGAFGFRIPLDEVFANAEVFQVGGVSVGAPSRVHRLLHGAFHAVLGSPIPRLQSLRDIARYLSDPALGPDVVVPAAQRWRGEAVLALAVEATADALPVALGAWTRWAAALPLDPGDLGIVERHRREGSALGPAKLDSLRELRGVRAKAAYAAALAWPTSEHLAARGQRRSDALRSIADVLRR